MKTNCYITSWNAFSATEIEQWLTKCEKDFMATNSVQSIFFLFFESQKNKDWSLNDIIG